MVSQGPPPWNGPQQRLCYDLNDLNPVTTEEFYNTHQYFQLNASHAVKYADRRSFFLTALNWYEKDL